MAVSASDNPERVEGYGNSSVGKTYKPVNEKAVKDL